MKHADHAPQSSVNGETTLVVGKIVGVHGIRGDVKLYSDCRPREAILRYQTFIATHAHLPTLTLTLKHGRTQGQGVVAQFIGIENRDQAAALNGYTLSILRSQLKKPRANEYYWADLVGLRVINREAQELGIVKALFETGANDVLVIEHEGAEWLMPFALNRYIDRVDLPNKALYVDWQLSWNED
ncbi:MAG: ribosome maturation factor RimM [Cardiobacteriaceae bacterium]|nr:ribosome maturation factor RimM [Cardiobacteriaceae bacterium]